MHTPLVLRFAAALAAAACAGAAVRAETPADLLAAYATAAGGSAGFSGFSAERGRQFFGSTHGSDWSCATCHTQNPAATGRHVKTGKSIAPLAPSASPARFTDPAKAEKWFKRNCNDVLGRDCTAQEKGDVLAYLIGVRP
ncbi:MAG TPA: DUF1924 domain-containing protein [Gammaproteobacteria bacterium]|nr:DUF1924 domain-containing protein [Gammaproteobacteria bacterium]